MLCFFFFFFLPHHILYPAGFLYLLYASAMSLKDLEKPSSVQSHLVTCWTSESSYFSSYSSKHHVSVYILRFYLLIFKQVFYYIPPGTVVPSHSPRTCSPSCFVHLSWILQSCYMVWTMKLKHLPFFVWEVSSLNLSPPIIQ